jgi:hypothetical protein
MLFKDITPAVVCEFYMGFNDVLEATWISA